MSRAARLETAAVFVAAAGVCMAIAAHLDPILVHPGLDDIWFESDMARNFQTLTDRQFDDVWPAKHPIFALLIWPFVALLRLAGAEPLRAVHLVLALNAGLFAAVLMRLLRADGASIAERLGVLAVLLASGGFWLWFAVPDTFAFGATSLLVGLAALAHDQRGAPARWWHWILASAAALAITVTNFAAAGVALGIRLLLVEPGRGIFGGPLTTRLGAAAAILVSAAALVMAGSFLQNRVFPGTGYAFSPRALAQEQRFVADYRSSAPAARLQTLLVAPVVVGMPEQRGSTARSPEGQLLSTLVVDGRWPATLAGAWQRRCGRACYCWVRWRRCAAGRSHRSRSPRCSCSFFKSRCT